MFRSFVLPAALVAALGFASSAAFADGETVSKDREGQRVEFLDRDLGVTRRPPARPRYALHRPHHHHGYHRRYARWDGRYGLYPRRHFFLSGVDSYGSYGSPVSYATVTYRTYVYYTPLYPSLSYGYPPFAHVYDLTPGPVYNKPCLC